MKMMKLKRSLVLTIMLIFLVSSVCMAYPIETPKWEPVGSNAEMSIFYDANTLTHYDGGSFCNVDVLIEFPAQRTALVMNNEYSKGMEVRILSLKEYNIHSGELLRVEENSDPEWHDITPGSTFEAIWNCVV